MASAGSSSSAPPNADGGEAGALPDAGKPLLEKKQSKIGQLRDNASMYMASKIAHVRESASHLSEKLPLKETIQTAYSGDDVVTIEKDPFWNSDAIIDYSPMKLSSYRALCVDHSAFTHPVLIVEQALTTCIFLIGVLPVMYFFKSTHHGHVSVGAWIEEQEPAMRKFAMIMTGLSTFLLSFYTAMAVSRWWTIRTQGIGVMKDAVMELELYMYQLVTKEKDVVSAIRRYARASLLLIFLWRRNALDKFKQLAMHKEILTEQEVNQLLKVNHNMHEVIWAWITDIVTLMYEEKKIQSDQLLNLLLDRCTQGRGAVQLIHTYLAVRVPMQYVHLLGFLVKLHNAILALIMGILFGAAFRDGNSITCAQLFIRTLLLPTLFNAILLINTELSDPFDGGMSDFPANKYDLGLEKDGVAFITCTDESPDWMEERRRKHQQHILSLPGQSGSNETPRARRELSGRRKPFTDDSDAAV